jgi:hypothetical protein
MTFRTTQREGNCNGSTRRMISKKVIKKRSSMGVGQVDLKTRPQRPII